MGVCFPKPQPPPTPTPTPPPPTPTPSPPPRQPTPPPTPDPTEDNGPKHVHIPVDKRTDEEKIEPNLKNYPKPQPPDSKKVQNIQQKNYWFRDDDFNNASDDADLFQIETAVDDISIDLGNLSDEIIERPSSEAHRAKKKPTLSYEEIDAHAKKADSSLLYNMDDLVKYLTEPLRKDPYQKMKTARAIVVWMSQQSLEKGNFGEKTLDTPRGLMQYLKEGKMTYTTCYTLLCRKVGLQCVVIKGYTKAATYEPGDNDVASQTWCAVHVECGWQIVMPFWVCRALFGHNLGGWVKVEEDGRTMRQSETASAGIVRNTFQDAYFMPSPEEFLYECCAEEKDWQLVRSECNVSSKKEFLEMPYLFPTFFGVGLELISEPKCVIKSKEGFCEVQLKTTPAKSPFLVLRYELFMKETGKDDKSAYIKEDEMSRMVFNSRAGETFIFDIRFPKTGTYKLVIYGGPYKSGALRLCEFKLVCEQEMKGRNLLPLECADIGWGPGPISAEAGLLMPSKHNGLIPVDERAKERKTEIRFQLQTFESEYTASVHGEVGGRRQQLDESLVVISKNKLHQLVLEVSIPGQGEFGLSISQVKKTVTAKSTRKTERVVCNYLLSTYAYKAEKGNVNNARKGLREAIASASKSKGEDWKKHIDGIENNINRCKKEKIADTDDELLAARETAGLLRCKDKLRDCKLRRNLGVVLKTLDAVNRYRNKSVVSNEIEKGIALKDELIALHGFARQVPRLEDAHKEIVALPHAQDEVLNTFKALLILLGEKPNAEESWPDILSMLKISTHSSGESVLSKMKAIKRQGISSKRRQQASKVLKKYKEDDVRKVNTDAHSFYVWIDNVIKAHGEDPQTSDESHAVDDGPTPDPSLHTRVPD